MSKSRTNQPISVGRTPKSIDRVAEEFRAAEEEGRNAFDTWINLTDRHSLDLALRAGQPKMMFLSWMPNWGRQRYRGWTVFFHQGPSLCSNCKRFITQLPRHIDNRDHLVWLLGQVAIQVRQCGCFEMKSTHEHGDDSPRVRISEASDTSKPRIKVVESQSNDSYNPSSTMTLHTGRIKLSKSSTALMIGDRPAISRIEDVDYQQRDSEYQAYNVPAIRYELSSGSLIDVTITLAVCEKIITHSASSKRHGREVGGIIVGHVQEKETASSGIRDYQSVALDIIEVESSDSSEAHICFDDNAWRYIERECALKHKGRMRLGWYHTHPTQGIFFSAQDVNAHTVFQQPFQFALVIDPRNMEAGLFYWSNRRDFSLEKSAPFQLRGESDQAKPIQKKGNLSLSRFAIFLVVMSILTIQIARGNPFLQVNPNYACLLIFTTFLGLRLWNAGSFHPLKPIESWAWHKFAGAASAGVKKIWELSLRIPQKALIFITLLLLAVVGLLLISFYARKNSPDKGSVITSQNPAASPSTTTAISSDTTPDLSRTIKIKPGTNSLTIDSKNPQAQISYRYKQRKWHVDWANELKFLNAVFDWHLERDKEFDYVKDLQNSLGIEVDGSWGGKTRRAWLEKILSAKAGDSINILLGDGKKCALVFETSKE